MIYSTDGQHDSWRSEAAIKKVVPHRVNDLWGTEDVKGKSWRWCRGEKTEEGEEGGTKAQTLAPGRWITDV